MLNQPNLDSRNGQPRDTKPLTPSSSWPTGYNALLVSEWILLNLFLGSLIFHLIEVFEPNTPQIFVYGLLSIAPALTCLLPGLVPGRFLPRLLVSLLLPLAVTVFLLEGDLRAWGLFHPSHWNIMRLLAYYLPLQGISVLTLAVFLYLEHKDSSIALLILATLLEMFVFSYVKRTWSFAFPLYFSSAILLQFVLRLKGQFHRYTGSSPGNTLGNSPERSSPGVYRSASWPRGTGARFLWVTLVISITLTLGLNVPTLAPVWLQKPLTLNGVLGKSNSGTAPFDRDTLFAWKTTDLGGPWQGDYTPLFYVQGPEPMYWRSETLDFYDPHGWWSRSGSPSLSNTTVPIRLTPSTGTLTYQVRLLQPLAQGTGLLVPGQLSELSKVSVKGATFSYNNFADTLWTDSVLPAKSEYTVEVNLPKYSADDLRKSRPRTLMTMGSGRVWNPWSLKDPIPLIQLTEQLTQGISNPYDKIQALSNYLKNTMTYTLNPPEPENGDLVSDFLFNTHEGYCIHFASALVLMTRVLGYASRLSIGFTYGNHLDTTRSPFPETDVSSVRLLTKMDAHSWAEVYFEGYGWVPFEATPGFSNPQEPYEATELTPLDPSVPDPSLANPNKKDKPEEQDPGSGAQQTKGIFFYVTSILAGLGLILLAVLVVLLVRRLRQRQRWLAMNGQERLGFLYREVLAEAKKYGLAPIPGATPAEFLRTLPLHSSEWNRLWTEAISLVEKGLYAPGSGEKEVEALMLLKPRLLRLLRTYKNPQKT